jgi:hypothetical protein
MAIQENAHPDPPPQVEKNELDEIIQRMETEVANLRDVDCFFDQTAIESMDVKDDPVDGIEHHESFPMGIEEGVGWFTPWPGYVY